MDYCHKTFLCGLVLLSAISSSSGALQEAFSGASSLRSIAALQELLGDVDVTQHVSLNDESSYAVSESNLTELCKNHTKFLSSSSTQIWAYKMKDSSTTFPPQGLLEGAILHLGNFDECINVRDIVWNNDSVFHGQHCLATIGVRKIPSVLREAKTLTSLAALAVKIAKCVPSSCNGEDVQILVKRDLQMYDLLLKNLNMEFVVHVNELECHTTEKPTLKTDDWIVVGILCFFGILVLMSTSYDVIRRKSESRSELLLAFSVYTNGRKLLSMTHSGDTLHCLHGIRFISMAWVVLGHRYAAVLMEPTINSATYLSDFFSDWKRLAITNGTLSVDTFFLLSGLLVAYVFFKKVPKTNSFNVPLYYLHRYIRLTPVFAVMILLQATLWRYAGSGPQWDFAASQQSDTCRQNWWINLLYVQNYVGLMNMCLGQSWYLAVDMQLFWLSPILLIPLWKWPVVGCIFMAVLMLGGVVSNFVISYVNEYPASFIDIMTDSTSTFFENFYMPAYSRYMPYVIGVATGYLLVELKKKERPIQFSKIVTLLLWLVAAGLMLLTLCIVHVFQQPGYEYEPIAASFYNSLGRPGWALGVTMVVVLCATGHGGFVNTLLSWVWFQPLNRLSYSVYLVHMSFQMSQYFSLRTYVHLDELHVFTEFFGDMIICLLLAAIFCLVFESPFIVLEKELLGGKKKPSRPAAVEVCSPNEHASGNKEENKCAVGIPEVNKRI